MRYGWGLLAGAAICLGAAYWAYGSRGGTDAGAVDPAALAAQSERGIYRVTMAPEHGPPAVGSIHAWRVTVVDGKNRPVQNAGITVAGGMPAHGHGLPTAPAAAGEIEPGVYRVDGIKFSMIGDWELRVGVEGPLGTDVATFRIDIE